MLSLDELDQLAGASPNAPSIIDSTVITREDLADRVRGLLHVLLTEYDAHKYRRAVFLSDNTWPLVVAMSAFTTLGVSFLGLDYSRSFAAHKHSSETVDADCIFYSAEFREEAIALSRDLGIPALCGDDAALTGSPTKAPLPADLVATASNRPYERIVFTSGTTDLPKAIVRTQSFDHRRFSALTERFGFTESDRHLVTVPFHHYSSVGWAKIFLGLGAPIILGDPRKPNELAATLTRESIRTMLIVAPTLAQVVALIEAGEAPPPTALRFSITGGGHFSSDLKKRSLAAFGPVVHEYYGSMETGYNVIASPSQLRDTPHSSGLPALESKVAIFDQQGDQMPPGETGRIGISSYQNLDSYVGHEPETQILNEHCYVLMPDYGYFDSDGLHVSFRAYKDTRTDSPLDTFALEDVLKASPRITDAFVIPHTVGDKSNRAVCAIVPHGKWDEGELRDALAEHLSNSGPFEIVLVSGIPYSPAGKVDRPALDQMVRSERMLQQ